MTKGINLYFSEKFPLTSRIEAIKEAGFDGVLISYPDPEKIDQNWLKDTLKANNLKIIMIHSRYDDSVLDKFWEEGEIGDRVEADYIKQIQNCKSFAPVDLVFHFIASKNAKYTEIGKKRISRMLKVANDLGVRICSENLYLADVQNSIMKDFASQNMRMCYDCGHENFLTPDAKYLDTWGQYITETHLHNNDGVTDQHKPIYDGSIDYNLIAKKFAKIDESMPLCLEVKIKDDTLSLDFLKAQKKSLDVLEAKVLEYRKELANNLQK